MFTRRIATAAMLLALFGAACGGGDGTNLATSAKVLAPATPAAPAVDTTATTAATLPPETVPAAEVAPAAVERVTTPAPTPQAASIEVIYQPAESATATATIDGPNGTHSKSLASGAALFKGLPAGTYAVTIIVDSPSGDPSIGDARHYLNGQSVHVEPGERGVITCDDNGCTGAL